MGRAEGGVLALEFGGAGVGVVEAEEQAGDLGAAGAEQAGEAEDLAATDVEVERLDGEAAAVAAHGEEGLAGGGGGVLAVVERLHLGEGAAHHVGDELEAGQLGGGVFADEFAVAQDGDAVGEGVNLVEKMGDEDDGEALVAQAAHDGEELLDLALVEGGGGLVEDEHARVDVGGAGDGDELLDGDGAVGERAIDVEVEAEAGEGGAGAHAGVVPADEAQAGALAAEADVFRDGEVGDEVDLLVNGADAGGLGLARGARVDGFAVNEGLAGVARVDAGEGFDERAFARSVLAHERVDLAGARAEVHAVERDDARETFGETAADEGGFGHGREAEGRSDGGRRAQIGDLGYINQ